MVEGRSAAVRVVNYARDGTALQTDVAVVPVRDGQGVVRRYIAVPSFVRMGRGG